MSEYIGSIINFDLYVYLQVSSNGLISAREPFDDYMSREFTRQFTFSNPIIAPLWEDFDSTEQGSIYYRATNDSFVLEQIVELIANSSSDYVGYKPKQAFIATWEDIVPYSNSNLDPYYYFYYYFPYFPFYDYSQDSVSAAILRLQFVLKLFLLL